MKILQYNGKLVYQRDDGAIGSITDYQTLLNKYGLSLNDFPTWQPNTSGSKSTANLSVEDLEKRSDFKMSLQDAGVSPDKLGFTPDEQAVANFEQKINVNQDFINEYKGKTIYDTEQKKYFKVTEDGVENMPEYAYGTAEAQQSLISYGSWGLPPANKTEYMAEEAYKYVNKDTNTYKQAASNNFGQGTTYTDDQYTGNIIGYSTGGQPLYELKDGNTTAQAPSASVTINDISAERQGAPASSGSTVQTAFSGQLTAEFKGDANHPQQTFTGTKEQIEKQARAAGINPVNLFYNGSNTPGVVPSRQATEQGMTDLMTIRSQRSDLQSLYDENGNAINPDDPRVAGIPTLQDWWNQYGKFEYPGTSVDGLASAGDIMPDGTVDSMNFDDLPPELRDSEFFKALPDDQKKIVASTYLANMALGDADKAMWLDAIEQSKELVEPFYAQQLVLAQDEIIRGFENKETAYQARADLIEKNIARIEEDLATGKDRLSIDQQAALARLKDQYQNQFIQLQDQIGNKGMAFGSRASDLLSQAAREQRDVNMSTNRSFSRRIEDMNKQAQRSIEDENTNKTLLEEQRRQELTNLSRSAEELLGTDEFGKLISSLDSGLQDTVNNIGTLGNITGTLEQEKTQDILSTASTLKGAGELNL